MTFSIVTGSGDPLFIKNSRKEYIFSVQEQDVMEESTPLIQRRTAHRKTVNISIRFFFSNTNYSGLVTDLSVQGMFIQSLITLPSGSLFPIIIRNEQEVLIEHVRVKHFTETNNDISGMGVEILYPSQGYLEFVKKVI